MALTEPCGVLQLRCPKIEDFVSYTSNTTLR